MPPLPNKYEMAESLVKFFFLEDEKAGEFFFYTFLEGEMRGVVSRLSGGHVRGNSEIECQSGEFMNI